MTWALYRTSRYSLPGLGPLIFLVGVLRFEIFVLFSEAFKFAHSFCTFFGFGIFVGLPLGFVAKSSS